MIDQQQRSKLNKPNHTNETKSDLTVSHTICMYMDYYMDFSPHNVKRIFLFFFPLNRLFKLLLIYCLFYHSVWWLPNSTSNNLAINYSNINSRLFSILLYYNFHEIFISNFFIRIFCFNILKFLRLIPVERLKHMLNMMEISIYILINITIFYYLKCVLNSSVKHLTIVMLPHLFIYFQRNFDIHLKIFNQTILSNEPSIKKLNQNEYQHSSETKYSAESDQSAKTSFTDCSNMSISTFLTQPVAVPNILTSINKSQPTIKIDPQINQDQTLRIIKQSLHRARTAKMVNFSIILSSFPRQLATYLKSRINSLWQFLIKFLQSFLLNIPKANKLTIKKRDIFENEFSSNELTNCIQHICHKNAIGLREECNWFSFEFTNRLKQICIFTFECVYYNFFISRLFVPTDVYIREREYYMYMISSIISTFISYWLYLVPFSFLKTISNNAEHLGYWHATNEKQQFMPAKWINTKSYCNGDKVVYMGRVYVAITNHCAAIPSNKFYSIYFSVFSAPLKIIRVLVGLKMVNILLLLALIQTNRRWYAIALSILEIVCNSHTFFILMRDFFVFFDSQNYIYEKFK